MDGDPLGTVAGALGGAEPLPTASVLERLRAAAHRVDAAVAADSGAEYEALPADHPAVLGVQARRPNARLWLCNGILSRFSPFAPPIPQDVREALAFALSREEAALAVAARTFQARNLLDVWPRSHPWRHLIPRLCSPGSPALSPSSFVPFSDFWLVLAAAWLSAHMRLCWTAVESSAAACLGS